MDCKNRFLKRSWKGCLILLLAAVLVLFASAPVKPMEQSMYRIENRTVDGFEVYTLHEQEKAVAKIVPALGNNCYAFNVKVGDAWLEIIDSPPGLLTLREKPTAYGNPVLFPFPNRIRDGRWTFEGKSYQFDKSPEAPTTIHGLLLNRAYQVEQHALDKNSVTLVCSLNSRDFPDIGRQYPFPFRIEMTYTLKNAILGMRIAIQNLGTGNMPMGFGIHPYFRVALTRKADAGRARITVPAAKYWELDEVLVPTGKQHDVTGILDLRHGQPFSKLKLDHILTDVYFTNGMSRCQIENLETGHGVAMESDTTFRELVVYTPPGRNAICFEPYTCPSDAINLEAKGIPAGVIVLPPGKVFSATVRFMSLSRANQ